MLLQTKWIYVSSFNQRGTMLQLNSNRGEQQFRSFEAVCLLFCRAFDKYNQKNNKSSACLDVVSPHNSCHFLDWLLLSFCIHLLPQLSIEKEVMEGTKDDTKLQPPSGASDPQKSGSQASTAKKKTKSKGNVFWTTRLDWLRYEFAYRRLLADRISQSLRGKPSHTRSHRAT